MSNKGHVYKSIELIRLRLHKEKTKEKRREITESNKLISINRKFKIRSVTHIWEPSNDSNQFD